MGPVIRRWRHRTCHCQHPRSIHAPGPRGWTVCNALRCPCASFVWAWLDKPLLRMPPTRKG